MVKIYNKDYKLQFGKYEGKSVGYIMKKNPSYLLWCDREIEWFKITNKKLKKEIQKKDRFKPGDIERGMTASQIGHLECFGSTGPNGGWGGQI